MWGGRKNKVLIEKIQHILDPNIKLKPIDVFKINGDFIESQAFAFLAIRSFVNYQLLFQILLGVENLAPVEN